MAVGEDLRTTLRAALTVAMKERDAAALAAIRSALSAIDNAEAVDPAEAPAAPRGGRIPGAVTSLGAGEVARRQLTPQDMAEIVRSEIAERAAAADNYERLAGGAERAARLRAEAACIARLLDQAG